MTYKILISMPVAMRQEIEFVSKVEHRNFSDLIREACRRYLAEFRRNNPNPRHFTFIKPEDSDNVVIDR